MHEPRLKSSALSDAASVPVDRPAHINTRRRLPFHLIEGMAICVDVVLIVVASVLTCIAYHMVAFGGLGPIETFVGIGVLTAVNFSAILAARGAYAPKSLSSLGTQIRETAAVWLFVFLVLSVVAFALKITETYSRGATLTFFVVGWGLITGWRLTMADLIEHALAVGGFAEQKTILIAEKGQLAESSAVEELRRCGYQPVRTFEFPPGRSSGSFSSWLRKAIDEIIEISRQQSIECVFLLVPWDHRNEIEQMMELLRAVSVPVYLLPDCNVAQFLGSRVVNVGTTWTAELKRAPLSRAEQTCKRIIDVVVASLTLVLLTPLMIITAALIKAESNGPILFMQKRNGFNGRPFRMCKFRTMTVLEDGPVIRQVTKDDPRVTRCGRLLRRTNIDELPQLFNVLAGDMSLVGPRPHASAHNTEYEQIIANYANRYHVKPGITGWAQVNGFRGETRTVDLMKQRVDFDLWYINNWSLWLDVGILLRTLFLGLQPNAY
jgi:Undecaprenyl-phosphate glucose phosphotransferase